MKILKKEKKLRAFTLAELIVAVIIGSIVLTILTSFITTSMNEITFSNQQTQTLENVNVFSTTMNNYKGTFGEVSILVNTGTGSDVIMMQNTDQTEGILVGVVKKSTLRLEQSQEDYETLYEKHIGFRNLTAADIVNLTTTPTNAYTLEFQPDKILYDLYFKDLQATIYNGGSIVDMDIELLTNYKPGVDGSRWDEITNDWIYRINMIF